MIRALMFLMIFSASLAAWFSASAQESAGVDIIEIPKISESEVAALPDAPLVTETPMEREINERLEYLKPNVDVNLMSSLFFTDWEHDLILDARRGLVTRLGNDASMALDGPRDIALGGIVYVSKNDWTVWLNNVRITPDAIPSEIMDIRVFKEHIDLEWFDATTNQIFPIRLRAHQRFNLDTRIFLPGV